MSSLSYWLYYSKYHLISVFSVWVDWMLKSNFCNNINLLRCNILTFHWLYYHRGVFILDVPYNIFIKKNFAWFSIKASLIVWWRIGQRWFVSPWCWWTRLILLKIAIIEYFPILFFFCFLLKCLSTEPVARVTFITLVNKKVQYHFLFNEINASAWLFFQKLSLTLLVCHFNGNLSNR